MTKDWRDMPVNVAVGEELRTVARAFQAGTLSDYEAKRQVLALSHAYRTAYLRYILGATAQRALGAASALFGRQARAA